MVDVDPSSEQWREGSRSIQEKTEGLRKQKLKRRWKRIVLGGLTTVLLVMVVTKSFTVETTLPPPPPPSSFKISGRVMSASGPLRDVTVMLEGSKLTSTTTDANGNYTFDDLSAGGSYTINPRAQARFSPPSRSFNELRQNESADFLVVIRSR